jgi:hypothetical protein
MFDELSHLVTDLTSNGVLKVNQANLLPIPQEVAQVMVAATQDRRAQLFGQEPVRLGSGKPAQALVVGSRRHGILIRAGLGRELSGQSVLIDARADWEDIIKGTQRHGRVQLIKGGSDATQLSQ